MILIAYDASPSSQRAIVVAGALLTPRRAHVIHVWEVVAGPAAAVPFAAVALEPAIDEDVARQEREARAVAEAGAAAARAAGFQADAEAIQLENTAVRRC